MKRYLILVVLVVLLVSGGGYYWYRANKPPAPVIYSSPSEIDRDIERLSPLFESGRISWQDTYRLGVAYLQKGRFLEAARVLEEAIRRKPDFQKSYESLGMVYYRLGEMDKAIDTWQRALQLNPQAKYLEEMVGRARQRKALFDRIASLEREMAEGKVTWQKRFELATLYLGIRRTDAARTILEEVAEERKDNPDVYTALAEAYAMGGDFEKAVEAQKRAVELRPEDEGLRRRLEEMEKLLEGLKRGDFHRGRVEEGGG